MPDPGHASLGESAFARNFNQDIGMREHFFGSVMHFEAGNDRA